MLGAWNSARSGALARATRQQLGSTRIAQAASGSRFLSGDVSAAVRQWIDWDPNPNTRATIEQLAEQDADAELRNRLLCDRIQFSTAGLRARMDAGVGYMNELTVLQASQGLARYLQAEGIADRGVVVGFDHRAHGGLSSRAFAERTVAVLASQGIPVYFFRDLVPTPLVPIALLELNAAAGVMVTASHNPGADNGFKVYGQNSAQITSPVATPLSQAIGANLEPWAEAADVEQWLQSSLVVDPTSQIVKHYCNTIKKYSHKPAKTDAVITYTAMHGVGFETMQLATDAFELPQFVPVPAQVEPDPTFPTVKLPNPEEGEGALRLSMECADAAGSKLILAHDPDADRLAVAEKQQDGEWRLFNGNEIALLFADWLWTNRKELHPDTTDDKFIMLASTVSSKALKAMAAHEGFQFDETLTGFKWLGNRAAECEALGLVPLLAYEVEIGFMIGTCSLDKDGIRAAAVMAELANQHYSTDILLSDRLESLYSKYGYFGMEASYFMCDDPAKMGTIFDQLRPQQAADTYDTSCGGYAISAVRDLTTGFDSSQPDDQAILPVDPSSQMITFTFENGAVCTLRGSGTEPKLKFYVEAKGATRGEMQDTLSSVTTAVIDQFLQPDKNELQWKE